MEASGNGDSFQFDVVRFLDVRICCEESDMSTEHTSGREETYWDTELRNLNSEDFQLCNGNDLGS